MILYFEWLINVIFNIRSLKRSCNVGGWRPHQMHLSLNKPKITFLITNHQSTSWIITIFCTWLPTNLTCQHYIIWHGFQVRICSSAFFAISSGIYHHRPSIPFHFMYKNKNLFLFSCLLHKLFLVSHATSWYTDELLGCLWIYCKSLVQMNNTGCFLCKVKMGEI